MATAGRTAARTAAVRDTGAVVPTKVSLRSQLAFAIALLTGVPNIVMVAAALLPAYQRSGGASSSDLLLILVWVVAVILLSAVMGYLLSGHLLAPVLRLTKELGRLPDTAPQVASARLSVRPGEPREVQALTGAFNELLVEVEGEQSMRGAFLAALMHDLKTPLVAATNLLVIVRDDPNLLREQRIAVVGQITNELQSLIELVQKLVDAHRLERSELPLAREKVDLRGLVGVIVARLDPLVKERGLTVSIEGDATAFVDYRELERALYNLISNAVRYARTAIRLDIFPGLVRLSDDGPGLPAPLDDLAQPFNDQGVAIAGRRYAAGSGGLGLYIARRILDAHGGRLVAEASGPTGTALLAYLGPSR